MNSRKFVLNIFIYTFLTFVFFSLLIFFFFKTSQHMFWIDNSLNKKVAIAKSITKPKLVFVAGSSTLFGINTKTVEESIKIPVVNFGVHAGLRTDYILYRTKQILNKGDTVILPLEYHNLTWNGEESLVRRNYILTHDHGFFINELDFLEKTMMLISIKPFELFKNIINELKIVKEAKIGENYNSSTLNENGDETYKNGNKLKKILKGKPFEIDTFIETKGLNELKNFSKWCKSNDIKLFVTFPSTLYFDEYRLEKYQNFFNNLKKYLEDNHIEFFGEPLNFLYAKEYFYDSYYHLNTKGSNMHTKKLIDEISIKGIK